MDPGTLLAGAEFAVTIVGRLTKDKRLLGEIKEVYAAAASATIDACVEPDLRDEVTALLLNEKQAAALASFVRREQSELPKALVSLSEPVWTKIHEFIKRVHDGLSGLLPLEMLIANEALEIRISQLSRKIDELAKAQAAELAELAKAQAAGLAKLVNAQAGGPVLTLYESLRYKEGSELTVKVLTPYARSIPLLGRDEQLASLHAWLDKPSMPVAVRVITGSGGVGKTRLALELCWQARDRDWEAGFVAGGEVKRLLSSQAYSAWRRDKPTLLVIDYAASRAKKLFEWLTTLTPRAGSDASGEEQPRLRVLLLERWADPTSGWWLEAFGRGSSGDAAVVQQLLDPAEPVPLPKLDQRELRREILASIMALAGAAPPAEGEDEDFDRRLATLDWAGDPLFLMMAGLLAAEAGVSNALALSRTDLGYEVANHELARIDRIAKGSRLALKLLRHMAGYVTLCGGLSESDAHKAIKEECDIHGYEAARASVYEAL